MTISKRFPNVSADDVKALRAQGFRRGIEFAMESINHRIPLYTFPEALQQLYTYLREVHENGRPKRTD